MKRYPQLKFCGLTRAIDVEYAIEAKASAIGLNFVPGSKRCVDPIQGAKLSQVAAGRIERVGVFANSPPEEIARVLKVCTLDSVQLHGQEDRTWLARAREIPEFSGLPLIRALPYRGGEDDEQAALWCQEANDPTSPVAAILIDAFDPTQFGGTGKTTRWDLLFPRPLPFFARKSGPHDQTPDTPAPMILAGGIHRQNVADAMKIAQPEGIDLASGIESSPGVKDRDAMIAIAELVRFHFDAWFSKNA